MTMVLDGYSTWLDFTLACPDAMPSVTRFSMQQADGSQVQGTWFAPGVLQLVPDITASQETWVLSAGIHGNETAPIEWLNQLLERWRNREWVLKAPTLLIMGNPRAMVLGQRFISTNLNRLFNPKQQPAEEAYEEQRAYVLKKAVDRHFQAYPRQLVHYDLHTAIRESIYESFAVCPVSQAALVPTAAQFLADAEIQAVLLNTQTCGSTFSYYSAVAHKAEAATVELGKVHPFGSNDLTRLAPLTKAVVTRLGCQASATAPTATVLQDETSTEGHNLVYFKVIGEIIRQTEHFELYVEDATKNFTAFAENSLIARDINHEYRVGPCAEYILFPNPKVQVGHRAALMVTKLHGAGS
jgi:succinylglutamate desuccinylase